MDRHRESWLLEYLQAPLPIGVAAMPDGHDVDDYFAVIDSIDHPILASARRVQSRQLCTQRLSDAMRVLREWA